MSSLTIADVQRLVRDAKVDCNHRTTYSDGSRLTCGDCSAVYYGPLASEGAKLPAGVRRQFKAGDPVFDYLFEKCTGVSHDTDGKIWPTPTHPKHCDCAGFKYIPRLFDGYLDGELRGGLEDACAKQGWRVSVSLLGAGPPFHAMLAVPEMPSILTTSGVSTLDALLKAIAQVAGLELAV